MTFPRPPGRRLRGSLRLGSLRNQLLRWLLIPLVLLVAVDAVFVYQNALDAADLAYDRSLLASTRALAERVSVRQGRLVADVPYVALDSFETDTLGRIYYKVTGIHGEFVAGYDDLPAMPKNTPRSDIYPALVYFYHATYRGEAVRIAALYQPVYDESMRGIAMIQVGESYEARSELTRRILLETLWRQAALVLAAVMLAWIAVRFVLRPLMQLRQAVEARTPTDLSDFDPALVHREVRPLIEAMNGYMTRLRTLISGQQRFIADASHQLRTPLAVLKTQAEMALREDDPRALRDIVASIARTTDATVHLANRLLTLARAEHGVAEGERTRLSLADLAQQVGLELAQQAVKKDIDLSLEAEPDVEVEGSALLLHEMVSNLVDNAIRYTPAGGRVALRVKADPAPLLEVEDTGPGIPEGEREKVFSPFYRAPSAQAVNSAGTGLGMTIVRDIAALHGARITLDDGDSGMGLKVGVWFEAKTAVKAA
ncbi:two-component system, OmpR family, sensor histidine kinase TctE [Noviherbaspirillum humi]|uniref:histidine kinase n=1 Tax=Noviherbaspirillum humi TaxID=1688639 RepID=A0A239C278_9BURK|nr:sensor histidine kinase [Noviherbaspirillum humi]SNS14029.1 two-component system, OmpR family, sensor histidine kinase TctE [Noviherbaspirillum humi]